ncbi:MAG: Crp/Fnr family transcriptional regulator [Alphaproteobacteria bacterium]|nr:Crp/Fnr family transcriptional regulator [Alphaproteobacteria bacterium]
MVRAHNNIVHRANALLAALDADDFERLESHMRVVPLGHQQELADAGKELDQAYFPHSGAISLMAAMREGGYAEITTVGPEGVAGLAEILGAATTPSRVLVQVAGVGTRIPIRPLRAMLDQSATFRAVINRYIRATFIQLGQSVACNGLHSVEERFARWLLMAHDRARRDTFDLTQALLAEMLGVHRPSVTVVARMMQSAGLIRYSRGVITVTDRKGLEATSCECYGVVRRAYSEILGRRDA